MSNIIISRWGWHAPVQIRRRGDVITAIRIRAEGPIDVASKLSTCIAMNPRDTALAELGMIGVSIDILQQPGTYNYETGESWWFVRRRA